MSELKGQLVVCDEPDGTPFVKNMKYLVVDEWFADTIDHEVAIQHFNGWYRGCIFRIAKAKHSRYA